MSARRARAVACPTCGVGVGEDCRTLRPYVDSRVTEPHQARRERAAVAPTTTDALIAWANAEGAPYVAPVVPSDGSGQR